MDKRDLADEYITAVQEDLPTLTHGPGLLSVALIRACEDLLICRDEFSRYKEQATKERRALLAEYLNIPLPVLESVLDKGAQMAAGEEHPLPGPDPQAPSLAEHLGPVSLQDDTPDLVRCPNCGEWASLMQTRDGESTLPLLHCFECDYEELR